MREESHLDDMRAAIRGDFERLAERRGGQELMSPPPEDAGPGEPDDFTEPSPPPEAPAPAAVPVAAKTPLEDAAETEAVPEPEEEPVHEPKPAEAPVEAPVEAPRRSWLARLLGR